MSLRFRFLLALLVTAPLLTSCGSRSRRLELHPVSGQVLVDGNPAKGIHVQFWPQAPLDKEMDAYSPRGETDEKGEFKVSTYVTNDGAPAGEYTVTLHWPERFNPISTQWEGDKLKGRYRDAGSSKLRATVEKKPNQLPPIKVDK